MLNLPILNIVCRDYSQAFYTNSGNIVDNDQEELERILHCVLYSTVQTWTNIVLFCCCQYQYYLIRKFIIVEIIIVEHHELSTIIIYCTFNTD